ncbi:MAG TPA: hypothetical protein PKA90_02590 [Ignavibacteria bacterium]|nr:hypothetical protein [Ignavibacteria bacterium]HMR39296.1 hypothetical protein [Ignavibacteria bacterium]
MKKLNTFKKIQKFTSLLFVIFFLLLNSGTEILHHHSESRDHNHNKDNCRICLNLEKLTCPFLLSGSYDLDPYTNITFHISSLALPASLNFSNFHSGRSPPSEV